MNWIPWLLLVHVLGAIVGFGPTFAFSIIGAMGGKEPQHANFATRVSHRISERLTYPIIVVQGLTGVGLIIATGFDLSSRAYYWLDLGIVLYVIAAIYAYFVQRVTVERLIEATSAPPPPGASGPPPAVLALVKPVQQGGMLLGLLLLAIIFLMVVKPAP